MKNNYTCEFKLQALREVPENYNRFPGDTPEKINEYLRQVLPASERYSPEVENFIVVFLNTRRKIVGHQVLSQGTLDTLLVHPREVFKPAILMNAAAIVVAHNHPSGEWTPSDADVRVTRDLIKAGQLLKIELLDHIILGDNGENRTRNYCSLRELGYFHN
jgi:DNA repair protein RadC